MSTKTLLIGEIFEKGQRAVGHVPRDINQGSINEELGTRWIANKKNYRRRTSFDDGSKRNGNGTNVVQSKKSS